jgi:hypothetical protein
MHFVCVCACVRARVRVYETCLTARSVAAPSTPPLSLSLKVLGRVGLKGPLPHLVVVKRAGGGKLVDIVTHEAKGEPSSPLAFRPISLSRLLACLRACSRACFRLRRSDHGQGSRKTKQGVSTVVFDAQIKRCC